MANILLVDDEKSLRVTLSAFLRKEGHRVITCENVSEAKDMINQKDFSCVFTDILMEDGSWIAITAELGNYNRATQFLELAGTVNLFHDKGYEFRTTSAVLDLRAGDAIGTEPLQGQGSFGHLQAEGFTIRNRGERVELHGKSQVILLNNPTDIQKGLKKK